MGTTRRFWITQARAHIFLVWTASISWTTEASRRMQREHLCTRLLETMNLGGGNQEASMAMLNHEISEFNSTYAVSDVVPTLTMSHLMDSSTPGQTYPILHGKGVKAANTRHLVPFLMMMSQRLNDGSIYKTKRAKLFWNLHCFYDLMYSAGAVLTPHEAGFMRKYIFSCCKYYVWLALDNQRRAIVAYNIVPKLHYFAHIALRADYLNPRVVQTYLQESLMGRVCLMWRQNLAGSWHEIGQKTFFRRYLLAFFLLLMDVPCG